MAADVGKHLPDLVMPPHPLIDRGRKFEVLDCDEGVARTDPPADVVVEIRNPDEVIRGFVYIKGLRIDLCRTVPLPRMAVGNSGDTQCIGC